MSSKAILIPAFDKAPSAGRYLELLLSSIERQGIYEEYDIVPLWDSCTDKFIDYFLTKYPSIRFGKEFINRGKPRNFTGNVNMGLKILHGKEGKDVLVVNQDCILPPLKFVRQITGEGVTSATQICIQKCPCEKAYETCACDRRFSETPDITKPLDELVDYYLPLIAGEQDETPRRESHKKVTGFCMNLPAKLLDKIGYIDEYFKAGYDDNDLCIRAHLAGFPVEKVNVKVHHFISKLKAYDGFDLVIRRNQMAIKWQAPLELDDDQVMEYILKRDMPAKEEV